MRFLKIIKIAGIERKPLAPWEFWKLCRASRQASSLISTAEMCASDLCANISAITPVPVPTSRIRIVPQSAPAPQQYPIGAYLQGGIFLSD